jgi:hypothetical protein
VDDTPKTTS